MGSTRGTAFVAIALVIVLFVSQQSLAGIVRLSHPLPSKHAIFLLPQLLPSLFLADINVGIPDILDLLCSRVHRFLPFVVRSGALEIEAGCIGRVGIAVVRPGLGMMQDPSRLLRK
jgi:hypothetical protein